MKAWKWRLIVRDGRNHDLLLHRLGLRPSKYNTTEYFGYYAPNAKAQLLRHIDQLREARLHGVAKKVPDKTRGKKFAKARPKRAVPGPDTKIIELKTAKANRLARDALKLAQERRRQAEIAAEIEVNRRAKEALLRAKGEM